MTTKPLRPVELPYTGGIPAPGSALTPEMLHLLGRPIPQAPPPDEEEPPPAEFEDGI